MVDVGGNFFLYITMGRENFHCCCPNLGVRDSGRLSTRIFSLDTWAREQLAEDPVSSLAPEAANRRNARKRRAMAIQQNPGQYYCRRLAQDCFVQADVLLFLDSLYDIAVDHIGKIMLAHKAKKGYG